MFSRFSPIKYILIIWGGDALTEGQLSEVILGKRKLKGKHVSIYLRSRPSYSDRNIPRDEQGSSISSSRLMKHFYRWRSHLFYSVLTKQLLFPFIEWAYSQGNQALYLWCFPGSLNGHIHRETKPCTSSVSQGPGKVWIVTCYICCLWLSQIYGWIPQIQTLHEQQEDLCSGLVWWDHSCHQHRSWEERRDWNSRGSQLICIAYLI